jgi:hypothetical protein
MWLPRILFFIFQDSDQRTAWNTKLLKYWTLFYFFWGFPAILYITFSCHSISLSSLHWSHLPPPWSCLGLNTLLTNLVSCNTLLFF